MSTANANRTAPIDQEWVKRQVDVLLETAKVLGPNSAMGNACLVRAEYYMDLMTAWRERKAS